MNRNVELLLEYAKDIKSYCTLMRTQFSFNLKTMTFYGLTFMYNDPDKVFHVVAGIDKKFKQFQKARVIQLESDLKAINGGYIPLDTELAKLVYIATLSFLGCSFDDEKYFVMNMYFNHIEEVVEKLKETAPKKFTKDSIYNVGDVVYANTQHVSDNVRIIQRIGCEMYLCVCDSLNEQWMVHIGEIEE
jgi:hypothetical protein